MKQEKEKRVRREKRRGRRKMDNSEFHDLLMVSTPWDSESEGVTLK